MGGILVGVLAAVRIAHQIRDLIIVVLPVCPVQAQSTLDFFRFSSGNRKIGMTGLTGCAEAKKKPTLSGRFFTAAVGRAG